MDLNDLQRGKTLGGKPMGGKEAPDSRSALTRGMEWLRGGNGEGVTRYFMLFLALFGLGMGLVSLLGDQGWLAYRNLSEEAHTLRTEVEALHLRRTELASQIEALNRDPQYIEFLARRDLRYVKPGETVVEFNPRPEWEARLRGDD